MDNMDQKKKIKTIKILLQRKQKIAYHVISRYKSWAVIKTGSERATRVFKTMIRAIFFGFKLARKKKTALVIHRSNGLVLWWMEGKK